MRFEDKLLSYGYKYPKIINALYKDSNIASGNMPRDYNIFNTS